MRSILKNGLEKQPLLITEPNPTPIDHENIRGADYYKAKEECSP